MAAAPASAAHAPHVPPTAVVHPAKVEATTSLVLAALRMTGSHRLDQRGTVMQERGHRGKEIVPIVDRPMIAASAHGQRAAMTDHAANRVTALSVPRAEGRPTDPHSAVIDAAAMIVRQVAARHAAMVIVRTIVIAVPAVTAPAMIASHAEPRKEVMMHAVRSALGRAAGAVANNVHSVRAHPLIASTPEIAPVKADAHLPANRNRSLDRSG